jgi:transcriptional regulator with XRE-family HTH domain
MNRGDQVERRAHTELPRRVRAARAYAGLSVDELANRLGVGSKTIKRIEAGARLVRPYELWGIAEICGVSRDFFSKEELWSSGRADSALLVIERLDAIEAALATLVNQLAGS